MSDNPFSEPDDSDRTVIRPAPGGKRATPAAPAASFNQGFAPTPAAPMPGPAMAAPAGPGADRLTMGGSPLIAAAAPLLQLLARLRNTMSQPDAGDLRERAVGEMRQFEQAARAAQIPMDQLRPAHYALCASLDDVVLATPWGSQGAWAARSMVSTFHQEVRSGERFFDVLGQIRQNPGSFLPVLELMYFCLSLGYMGRYRLSPRGPAEIDKLREDTYAIIRRQKPAGEPGLSPHWQGVAAPYRPRRLVVPLWVVGVGAVGLIALVYGSFLFALSGRSATQFQADLAAPLATAPAIDRAGPVVQPPPPVSNQPTVLDRLRGFLAPEIAANKVSVLGTVNAPIVRINNTGLFGSGSASVEPTADNLLHKIGSALAAEKGSVQVIGYTDNQPIHTLQFPSNYQLSLDRAKAAAAILDQTIGDQSRLTAQGMGDADPVASNASADGRAQNRRIEVVLQRNGGN